VGHNTVRTPVCVTHHATELVAQLYELVPRLAHCGDGLPTIGTVARPEHDARLEAVRRAEAVWHLLRPRWMHA
jgi:hypothetical protein